MRFVGSRKVWSLEEVTEAVWVRFRDLRPFWVEAEVGGLRRSGSQVYFDLRGAHTVPASMSSSAFEGAVPPPADGMKVHAFGRMEFYRPRSRVTMRVERLELAGEGLLKARMDELRRRLAGEGLLDPGRKRSVPLIPARIALVTSAEGAARGDFVSTVRVRFPGAWVTVVPSLVQGVGAEGSVVRAIKGAQGLPGVEVVVVTRGGGSLEDLLAFNSEPVCRAVAECRVPVVSAVGHERDWTLCDEVADVRASTPTAAAAAVVPSRDAIETRLLDCRAAIARGLGRARMVSQEAVVPRRRRLVQALAGSVRVAEVRVDRSADRLEVAVRGVASARAARVEDAGRRARRALVASPARAASALHGRAALLRTLSPEATVERGYAIVLSAGDGRVLADADELAPGMGLALRMRGGSVPARVEEGPGGNGG